MFPSGEVVSENFRAKVIIPRTYKSSQLTEHNAVSDSLTLTTVIESEGFTLAMVTFPLSLVTLSARMVPFESGFGLSLNNVFCVGFNICPSRGPRFCGNNSKSMRHFLSYSSEIILLNMALLVAVVKRDSVVNAF